MTGDHLQIISVHGPCDAGRDKMVDSLQYVAARSEVIIQVIEELTSKLTGGELRKWYGHALNLKGCKTCEKQVHSASNACLQSIVLRIYHNMTHEVTSITIEGATRA